MRRGYTEAPLWLRIFLIHDLLCDNCNLLYRGFATSGALRRAKRRRRRTGGSNSIDSSGNSSER
ncbi:MAG TPA: hypothetical protein VGB76_20640 [Pyrinomonadaceae bacterium]